MKQVNRRHWEDCPGFILAYLVRCDLATKKTQEIRDEFPCTPSPRKPAPHPSSAEGQLIAIVQPLSPEQQRVRQPAAMRQLSLNPNILLCFA